MTWFKGGNVLKWRKGFVNSWPESSNHEIGGIEKEMVVLVGFHDLKFHELVRHVVADAVSGPFEVLKIQYFQ